MISDAGWRFTLVDATLVRYHHRAYEAVMRAQDPAARQAGEGTLAGLRFVRNRMGYHADPTEFIQPRHGRPGSGNGAAAGLAKRRRTVGKSTLLSQLARRLGRAVIDCDYLATRAAVRADPARFVESDQPVLIDEYQHVPGLLDAIKAQLNRDLRPGRYVLVGSTRNTTLPEAAQALTGRVDIIPVLPLSQGEIDNVPETFVARLLDDAGIDMAPSQASTTRDEYAQRSTSGGMPVALRRPPVLVRAGSPTTSTWSSTRMSWKSRESGSA